MNDEKKVKSIGYGIGYAGGVITFTCIIVLLVALTLKAVMMIFGGM